MISIDHERLQSESINYAKCFYELFKNTADNQRYIFMLYIHKYMCMYIYFTHTKHLTLDITSSYIIVMILKVTDILKIYLL